MRMPYFPQGSVNPHFKQRICQPGALSSGFTGRLHSLKQDINQTVAVLERQEHPFQSESRVLCPMQSSKSRHSSLQYTRSFLLPA